MGSMPHISSYAQLVERYDSLDSRKASAADWRRLEEEAALAFISLQGQLIEIQRTVIAQLAARTSDRYAAKEAEELFSVIQRVHTLTVSIRSKIVEAERAEASA